jgi:RNA polymerase sigma-70 factor (sigma-E family)
MDNTELLGGAWVSTRARETAARATEPRDGDAALTLLFADHYSQLVKLAALLVRDAHRAEEIVQDAFVDMHQRWTRLREPAKAAAYLRTAVVNRARSDLRHRKVVRSHQPDPARSADSAEAGALARLQQTEVMKLLDQLPDRQRSVLILRFYGQLSEAEIADTLGISRGAVKSHSSRGLKALRPVLESGS